MQNVVELSEPKSSSCNVVVVEDSVLDLEILTAICKNLGAKNVVGFSNPQEALTYLKQHYFDVSVVVTDLMMTPDDGLYLLEAMAVSNWRIPIIITSGLSHEIIRSTYVSNVGGSLDVLGYIPKPISAEKLEPLLSKLSRPIVKVKEDQKSRALSLDEIYNSINKRLFTPYFQPIINADDGSIYSFEVLSRHVSRDNKVLPPACYIDAMEYEGLLHEHDLIIYEKAFQQYKDFGWHDTDTLISVNVSPSWWLTAGQFGISLEQIAIKSGVSPLSVNLELTETCQIDDIQSLAKSTIRERMAGFKLVLDDYGSGTSGLSNIHNLPIVGLKIDRSIITGASHDAQRIELIKSTVSMAKSLGLLVTAEGIESKEDLNLAKRLGCDLLQGYFIAPPVPLDRLVDSEYSRLLV